jgi:putative DNA primase/helicase
MDIAALKAQLAASSDRLVVDLLGQPTAQGARYWRWGRRGSLSYDRERHSWHSFEDDRGGDLLDLIQFANPGWDFAQALHWARHWLGGAAVPDRPRRQLARFKAESTKWALRLWREARPAKGTLVETYLASRGLGLPSGLIGGTEDSLRFHPECPRGEARLPAMLGLMRGIVTDRPVGVHRTFLRDDGLAKAAVEPNKMMLGRSKGAVLKLSPDQDVTLGLGLTEGIEDGLAVLNSGFAPVWVCLSAGGLMNFPVLGGIETLTVFSDNDSAGARAAQACIERWQAAGKRARIVAPPRRLKDFGSIAEEQRHG